MYRIENVSAGVQSSGPAIINHVDAIGTVITKTNLLISDHRKFLANLPRHDAEPSRTTHSLITPPPSLDSRDDAAQPLILGVPPGVPPECDPFLTSASMVAAASIAALTSSLDRASSSILSLQGSAELVEGSLTSANVALTAANTALLSAQTSASLALSSANFTITSLSSSASAAIAAAQSSASSSVSSALSALSSIQSSANLAAVSLDMAVASANAVAKSAEASATLVAAEASASVSALSAASQATIAANRTSAMNTTKLALAITFAILGSSFLSILAYFFILRYRKRKRLERQLALKEKIRNPKYDSGESPPPSLSDFPMPVGRDHWSRGKSTLEEQRQTWAPDRELEMRGGERGSGNTSRKTWGADAARGLPVSGGPVESFTFPLPPGPAMRTTWHEPATSRTITANEMDQDGNTVLGSRDLQSAGRMSELGGPSVPGRYVVRKNTLTYDPEHPERPPKFTTWLEEEFRSVSPFLRTGEVNTGQGEMSRGARVQSEVAGGAGRGEKGSVIGTAM